MNAKSLSQVLQSVAVSLLLSVCIIYTATAQTAAPSNAAPSIPPEEWGRYKQATEGKNAPILFYGKVIDQDGNPVASVNVKLRVQQIKFDPQYFVLPKYIRFDRTTGPDGLFSLDGAFGRGIDIESITKPGYELEPNASRTYGTVSGSIDKPVTLRMWSTNIHEKLITGQKKFHIVPDGTPYVIDLNKGTIGESGEGDLKVWIKYAAHPVHGQTNDWACKIEVINGGLLEEERSDSSMYLTPTNGYAPAFQLQQQIKGGQRGSIGQRRFYVMLRHGQEYGRIAIELNAPFNNDVPGLIRLEYAINPTGSRVLKP